MGISAVMFTGDSICGWDLGHGSGWTGKCHCVGVYLCVFIDMCVLGVGKCVI